MKLIELKEAKLRFSLGEIRGGAKVEHYPTQKGFCLHLLDSEQTHTPYTVRSQRDRRMPKHYSTLEAVTNELKNIGIETFTVDLTKKPEPRIER
ncbi:hypothetical protein GZ77_20875 [Endozoicomonas montiporae]|uniref:Uncharacterized protein n=2 Tax=Endozoicomonas montiporae TaxID=1027273 RepID=A0A081N372_9GAMM|nr:hypothetical protein [Endozoicomonas montiporae]AMO58187.1 hypothetical protein EZMO1_4265 [Endozoicomonas montiporae CL-33]KEQ12895.1 hypothetical protein GZ77_20875 [Endozoicomonas montiporae]